MADLIILNKPSRSLTSCLGMSRNISATSFHKLSFSGCGRYEPSPVCVGRGAFTAFKSVFICCNDCQTLVRALSSVDISGSGVWLTPLVSVCTLVNRSFLVVVVGFALRLSYLCRGPSWDCESVSRAIFHVIEESRANGTRQLRKPVQFCQCDRSRCRCPSKAAMASTVAVPSSWSFVHFSVPLLNSFLGLDALLGSASSDPA